MSDEGIIVRTRYHWRAAAESNFEGVLEMLIAIAERERRGFLAYLLTMALVHVREEGDGAVSVEH
jgi:hypothetical protein